MDYIPGVKFVYTNSNTTNTDTSIAPMATCNPGYPEESVRLINRRSLFRCEYCRLKIKLDADFCAWCGAPRESTN